MIALSDPEGIHQRPGSLAGGGSAYFYTLNFAARGGTLLGHNKTDALDGDRRRGGRPKVLLLAFDSEELSIRLASGLAALTDVTLMLPEQRSRHHLKHLDPKVTFLPFHRPQLRQVGKQLSMITGILRTIRSLNPDVIHLQKWHLWFYLSLPLLSQYPLVISIHDPSRHSGDKGQMKTPMALVRFGYRRADRIIAHNVQMKEEITKGLGIAENVVDVIPLIERGDSNLANEVNEAGNEVLFFGRLWPYKGLDVLIRAEPLISAEAPQAKIVIAGRGEDFSRYQSMMADPSRFEVHNRFVSEQEQAELFRRCSVVVLPYWDATQSGVIPVAYTFHKPVVATEVGGLRSQVEDGQTGILVPRGDHRALAAAVVQLLNDPVERRRMGDNGKYKLEKEWAADVVARQTMMTYRKLDVAG